MTAKSTSHAAPTEPIRLAGPLAQGPYEMRLVPGMGFVAIARRGMMPHAVVHEARATGADDPPTITEDVLAVARAFTEMPDLLQVAVWAEAAFGYLAAKAMTEADKQEFRSRHSVAQQVLLRIGTRNVPHATV